MEVGVCVLFKKQVVLDLDFIGKGTTYTGVWYFFPSTCFCLNYRVQIALKKTIFSILVSICYSVVCQQL